ncbi:MAG: hypothetical protein ACRBHB_02590 [Arenicella sp.]
MKRNIQAITYLWFGGPWAVHFSISCSLGVRRKSGSLSSVVEL